MPGRQQIPDRLRWAVLAAEDHGFYGEPGTSPDGLVRALRNNMTGGDTQGGSTITQRRRVARTGRVRLAASGGLVHARMAELPHPDAVHPGFRAEDMRSESAPAPARGTRAHVVVPPARARAGTGLREGPGTFSLSNAP